MIEKGQIYEVAIEDMSNEGQGIGRIDGLALFVAGAIYGDVAKVEITKLKKNYGFGKVVEILTPSPYRITPPCDYAGDCGGCPLMSMSYEGQLRLKNKMVRDKLERIGGLENLKLHPIIGMESPFRYRNKAQFPVSGGGIITKKGGILANAKRPSVGFYKVRSHEVVNCETCLIQAPPAEALAKALRSYMEQDHVTAYDPEAGKGLIRHLIVKTAFATGEVMAIVVLNGKALPNGEKLVYMMDDAINELSEDERAGMEYTLESVVINVNKKKTSEIMGQECITLAGKPTILDRIGDLDFEISPLSFYQVNPVQTVHLYDKALEYAQLTGEETLLDLYCGVGTIGLYCAAKAKTVIGIEQVKGAVIDANRNAVINGIVNATFVHGKAEEEMPKLLEEGVKPDVVLLDPPRAGCAPELLDVIAEAAPERIVYVSCDPATLARDIKILVEKGYEFVEGQTVDMFPNCMGVESVILMSKQV